MTNNNYEPQHVNKKKIVFGVIIEIIVMAVEVLCCLLPFPWRLVVPIVIGARAIITKAVRYVKEPPTTPVVYCNGATEAKARNARKKTEIKRNGKTKKTTSKKAAGKSGKK